MLKPLFYRLFPLRTGYLIIVRAFLLERLLLLPSIVSTLFWLNKLDKTMACNNNWQNIYMCLIESNKHYALDIRKEVLRCLDLFQNDTYVLWIKFDLSLTATYHVFVSCLFT